MVTNKYQDFRLFFGDLTTRDYAYLMSVGVKVFKIDDNKQYYARYDLAAAPALPSICASTFASKSLNNSDW